MKLFRLLLFVVVSFVTPAHADSISVFGIPDDTSGEWKFTSWFGWYNDAHWPWIYHTEHAWIYCVGSGSSDIYLYDYSTTIWCSIRATGYPWMYTYGGNAGWYWYYQGGIPGERWFNRHSDGLDILETEMNQIPNGPPIVNIAMVFVEGGTFEMGDNWGNGESDELPVHTVSLSSFYMGETEVTNAQVVALFNWAYGQGLVNVVLDIVKNTQGNKQNLLDLRYDASPPCQISWTGTSLVADSGKEDYPVYRITRYGALAFANYLSMAEGLTPCYDLSNWRCDFSANGYRLPTEAEWEYAARGGNLGQGYQYSGSDDLDEVAWHWYNSENPDNPMTSGHGTHPVAQKKANELGLYDMTGNLYESCHDRYSNSYYGSSPEADPRGPNTGNQYVFRGGAWSQTSEFHRVASRGGSAIARYGSSTGGFRLVRGL